jgi:hypothetical protein
VIWWTGEGWSRHVNDAVDAGEHPEAILAREKPRSAWSAPTPSTHR